MMTLPVEPTRLRQVALLASDLEQARFLMTEALGAEVIYEDPAVAQWGLNNFLVPIGPDVLEILSPIPSSDPSTSATRLLSKRGPGGYMLIMQTRSALARKSHIELNELGRVIYTHSSQNADMVQYHPQSVPGGVVPELDSMMPSEQFQDPVKELWSPWHACGEDYQRYSKAMRRSPFRFLRVDVRLRKGQEPRDAAKRWEDVFGVKAVGEELIFENMRVRFLGGLEGKEEGIESLTVEVQGKVRFENILGMGRRHGLCGDGWMNMIGVKWYFELKEDEGDKSHL